MRLLESYRRLSLGIKILVFMALGIGAGFLFGESAAVVEPLGDLFIRLLMMAAIPLVFFSLLAAISGMTSTQPFPPERPPPVAALPEMKHRVEPGNLSSQRPGFETLAVHLLGTHPVYPGERVTYAIMGILYGAALACLAPEMVRWWSAPSALTLSPPAVPEALRWMLGAMAGGVFLSGLRDLAAARGLRGSSWPWQPDGASSA